MSLVLEETLSYGPMPRTLDGTVPDHLKCAHCKQLLNQACFITSCGCRFCQHHLDNEFFIDRTELMCPGGTDDCEIIRKGQGWVADKATRRNVLSLEILCPNRDENGEECGHRCIFRDLAEHYKTCRFLRFKCEYCSTEYPRHLFETHQDNCPQKPVNCEYCHKKMPLNRLSEHLEWQSADPCQMYRWECPYCQQPSLSYSELKQHQNVCTKWPPMCSFHVVGCKYTGNQIDAHLKSNLAEHQALLMKAVIKEKEVLSKENEELRKENKDLNLKCQAMHESTEKLKKEFDSRFKKMRNVQKVLANCRERQLDVDKMIKKYGSIEMIMQRLDSRGVVTNMEGSIPQSGTFLWRIDNFLARREAAEQGNTLSILSPPFLTEPYGYKMCCRLYPNGDGSGKGTHLSLFIVIMKSDYDSILRWPFSRRVTFKLMDQSGNGNPLSETFSPDQRSSSFKRPADEMNVASGCPRFIALGQLNSSESHYLRDDTIFIEVVIEKPPR